MSWCSLFQAHSEVTALHVLRYWLYLLVENTSRVFYFRTERMVSFLRKAQAQALGSCTSYMHDTGAPLDGFTSCWASTSSRGPAHHPKTVPNSPHPLICSRHFALPQLAGEDSVPVWGVIWICCWLPSAMFKIYFFIKYFTIILLVT